MKSAVRMILFCMTVVVMLAGVTGAEEASWYDAHEDWIVRVYTAPSVGGYEVGLEVVDTGNTLVSDPIVGMASNPVQITGAAESPDVSLAFDEGTATAYVIYKAGGVVLQPVADIKRAAAAISATPNPVLFGEVSIAGILKKTVTVTNTGNIAVNITSIGTPGSPFGIVATGTTCVTGMSLAAGGSCSIVVRFAPTEMITYNGSFVISSAGGNVTVDLNGSGGH